MRQREAVQEQQEILKTGPKEEKLIDSVRQRNPPRSNGAPRRQPKGNKQHRPAAAATGTTRKCNTCKRKGHFSSQCSVSSSFTTEPGNEYYDTAFLNTIGAGHVTSWSSTVAINGRETQFKLDTGAEVTVILEDVLTSLSSPKLHKATKRLCGPDKKLLDVLGELPVTLSYKGKPCSQPVYVVKELQQNLLGLPAIQALNLLSQVDTLQTTPVLQQFPALFTGLGTIQDSFEIKLKPDAKPYPSSLLAMSPFQESSR